MDNKIFELVKQNNKLKAIVELELKTKGNTKEDAYKRIIDGFAKKDITITENDIDEFLGNSKNNILSRELSSDELAMINGGGSSTTFDGPQSAPSCPGSEHYCGNGSNWGYVPSPACSATVEFNSWCWSDDQCYVIVETYNWITKDKLTTSGRF